LSRRERQERQEWRHAKRGGGIFKEERKGIEEGRERGREGGREGTHLVTSKAGSALPPTALGRVVNFFLFLFLVFRPGREREGGREGGRVSRVQSE